ncbi:MAG: hypothetical protein E7Z62_06500 [Thermoplasmata archaeon]|nr:hypothetical protein [Thermoplasmata archaeon]MBR4244960.1 hypothetical protein [Candidatus Methanomethylophilaceae archaeon]MBR6213410.1 hypothetical protein [Candidatus Methanomethylophilaceae archaeon]
MGFFEKTLEKTKASTKSISSKFNETKDTSKIQSQIKSEKEKVKECYETIGKEYYRFTYDGDESHKDCFDSLVQKINDSRKLIEEWEAQLEEIRAKGSEERENIKADRDAKLEEIEASDAEAKAEKERIKKEKDDTF